MIDENNMIIPDIDVEEDFFGEFEEDNIDVNDFGLSADLFATTLDEYEEFEKFCWAKKKGYALPKFPYIEKKLEGLEQGLYLFASESNVGKSAMMMNLVYDACMCETNNLFGIYYSLDDSKNEIIPRVIAMDQSIPIGVCAKPFRYQELIDEGEENASIYQDWLNKRQNGIEKLKAANNLFKIVDGNTIRSANDLYKHIKMVKEYIENLEQPKGLIVAIDSINDIKLEGRFASDASKHGEIARTVKDWTVEFNIPIFASTHLRKLNANRRPVLDDTKESSEYTYEASVVWLLYNDVSKNKQSAKVYWDNNGEKGPVIEIDWAKNKKSSYKGYSFCRFSPELSKVAEVEEEKMAQCLSKIFS